MAALKVPKDERQEQVVLARQLESAATVQLHGATVTSLSLNGCDRLFLSEKAVFNNKKAIRGGIPVIFPQFGPWDKGAQHGFARITPWVLTDKQTDPKKEVLCTFELEDNLETRSIWNHKFKVKYTVSLKKKNALFDFSVTNTGLEKFDFTCLLHTYFRVDDIANVSITGLNGLEYVDKIRGGATFTEDRELVTVDGNYDRVYKQTPNKHEIRNTIDGATIVLEKNNFPDTVVWNPWAEKAKQMSDFGDDEYTKMICVEAGYVSTPVTLQPEQTFYASQTIGVK
ncbi:putative glucose-6-phosphate 1-epimerase [Lytechinus variegatus]|uniref:putative glucose-6-phosphate 1-epimerase n=1 Tax=Lytechinus variegatus TaxID=7654 RepID=UPI001BB278FD|nr:putative glucose-6-phosphate 1-epimerase [Lytechinus variegatus]